MGQQLKKRLKRQRRKCWIDRQKNLAKETAAKSKS